MNITYYFNKHFIVHTDFLIVVFDISIATSLEYLSFLKKSTLFAAKYFFTNYFKSLLL